MPNMRITYRATPRATASHVGVTRHAPTRAARWIMTNGMPRSRRHTDRRVDSETVGIDGAVTRGSEAVEMALLLAAVRRGVIKIGHRWRISRRNPPAPA